MSNTDNKLKIGTFKVTLEFLRGIYENDKQKYALKDFIILEATTDWNTDIVTYTAISHLFDLVGEELGIPVYEVTPTTDETAGTFSVKVKRA